MKDDAFTDPAMIRATYAARGRNAKLNVAKAESLGVHASSVSPTQGGGTGGSGTASTGVGGSTVSGGAVLDPTLYNDPVTTHEETTYEEGPPREFTIQQ